MASRRAVILWSIAMALALVATTLRSVRAGGPVLEKTILSEAWTLKAPGVTTMVAARLAPGAEPVLVLQGPGFVLTASADGVAGPKKTIQGLAVAATGDVTGDGADEVLIATGPAASVQALDARLETLWSSGPLAGMAAPARLTPADLDKDRRREVLVGDTAGRVYALSPAGKTLWSWSFEEKTGKEADAVRGLDDQGLDGERRVVVARRSGELAMLDARGRPFRREQFPTGIRRLRLVDLNGDKDPEVLVGTENGASVLPDGRVENTALTVGGAVTEIRRIETDGDPATVELALGGKDGTVSWLAGRRVVASGHAGGKISELAGVDLTGDGRDELLVGTEAGQLVVFDSRARKLLEQRVAGKVERIASVVSPLRERLVVVAAGPSVTAYRLKTLQAPAWYHPLGAGALGLAVLGLVSATLIRAATPALPRAASPATAGEASLAKIQDMVERRVVSAEDAQDRLAQIRKRMAEPAKAARALPKSPPPPRPRG